MEIKQIIIAGELNSIIYGLGTDNKIYKWTYQSGSWEPHFGSGKKEEGALLPGIE